MKTLFSHKEAPSLRESSPFLALLLRLADSATVALLLYPLMMLYIGRWHTQYTSLALVAFFLSLLVFHNTGLYRSWRGESLISELMAILRAWLSFVFVILLILFTLKLATKYSRFVLLAWFVIAPLAIFLIHATVRKVLRILRARGKNLRTAVIVGAGDLGLALADSIERNPWLGIQVIGFFDDKKSTTDLGPDAPPKSGILGRISELKDYLDNNMVDFVYIALPMRAEHKIFEILSSCRTQGAKIHLVPDLNSFGFFNSRIRHLGDMLMLDFNPDCSMKRLFDVFFSAAVLLLTLPLTLVLALLIKAHDRGPVFYRHKRITATGRAFYCLKFRTMHVNAEEKLREILDNDPEAREEWERTFKLKNDPRITWIGNFLRKTSLDELPQFINVLKGEMSVVGARPIVSEELTDYYQENGGIYCSIKPGVTGIWQVTKRNDTEDYQERVELDTWYALNRNFFLDLKIILMTIGVMLKGKGAY